MGLVIFSCSASCFGVFLTPLDEKILRMWKGVRDAECGWLEVEESWQGQRVSSVRTSSGASTTAATDKSTGSVSGEYDLVTPVVGLYLAILAPLRGRVELWRMRHGPCVRTIYAPPGARLLTSTPSLGSGNDGISCRREDERDRLKLTSCYLLSGGGPSEGPEIVLKLDPLSVEEADLAILPSR